MKAEKRKRQRDRNERMLREEKDEERKSVTTLYHFLKTCFKNSGLQYAEQTKERNSNKVQQRSTNGMPLIKKTGGHRIGGRVTFRSGADHRSHNIAMIFEWSSVFAHRCAGCYDPAS